MPLGVVIGPGDSTESLGPSEGGVGHRLAWGKADSFSLSLALPFKSLKLHCHNFNILVGFLF